MANQKNMNKEQQQAFDAACRGENIGLLSAAGTGKTFVIKKIIDCFRQNGKILE